MTFQLESTVQNAECPPTLDSTDSSLDIALLNPKPSLSSVIQAPRFALARSAVLIFAWLLARREGPGFVQFLMSARFFSLGRGRVFGFRLRGFGFGRAFLLHFWALVPGDRNDPKESAELETCSGCRCSQWVWSSRVWLQLRGLSLQCFGSRMRPSGKC